MFIIIIRYVRAVPVERDDRDGQHDDGDDGGLWLQARRHILYYDIIMYHSM